MIAAATRNPAGFGEHASAVVGEATDLPFADDSFDLVPTSFSIRHWDRMDAAARSWPGCYDRADGRWPSTFPSRPFDELAGTGYLTADSRSRARTGIPFVKCKRMVLTG